ncbi:hypothetical protein PPYR_05768 [Photinus pyralis]|uniref:RUN domain-containing protein n=1 Tax=Photinus pyralis TaxID=7054 RepID=A0A1Y1LQP1_PHOPY|nr:RUN domain-containing protein 1 [Photinus pyralis]KAB0801414.1 hypothetical protein PPYR_05768 [Photinus pyralis]
MEDVIPGDEEPTGERWDPLGAPNDNEKDATNFGYLERERCDCSYCLDSLEKLRCLEEEQEQLNSSLFALTTHFAQVQFRLRQIVDAPRSDKQELLKALEEFAFRGIPDIDLVRDKIDEANLAETMRLRRVQQQQLIKQLKKQLSELERYAFETGEADVPQDVVLESQRVILNELKVRMNLELDEQKYFQLTPADVKQQVDVALGQLVTPLRMKEHLVAQLKTQVADLERFISYLQADSKTNTKCSCGCARHSVEKKYKASSAGMIQRTAALLQMFAMLQLGCGSHQFKKNNLKTTTKCNHWGDLRAKMEIAIAKVVEVAKATEVSKSVEQGNYSSDSESSTALCNVQVTRAVRKYLATSIRDLMQHGVVAEVQSHSLVPFIGCLSRKFKVCDTPIHAWEIIVYYYHLKNGERFNSTPARKLSQSFNLDIAGSSANSNKQNMLSIIGNIIATHSLYKRSYDSHFKAFICAALNAKKLVTWLSLIFQCRALVDMHYQPWSYMIKTGFSDGLQSLDTLTNFKFDLPVDLAIRQFQNIKDVFT